MAHVNTKFNPDGDFRDLDQWEAIALSKAAQQGIAAKVIGGILIGGVGVTMGVPALGGVLGAWLLKSAYDGISTSGIRLKIVRDLGCIAWVLDEVDFRTYVRQFGSEAVSKELHRAIDSDCELSNFAHNWLRLRSEPTKKIEPTREEVRPMLPGSPLVKPAPATHYEARNQLEAVLNKPSKMQQPNSTPLVKTITEAWNPFASSEIDIIKEAGASIKNLFIVGLGGSGKGVLLACLLREVKRTHPNRKIFLINGKDDPKEYGYFEDVADIQKRLNCETSSPSTVAAWFEAVIAEYDSYALENNGALLVIDEGTIIGARLKTAKCTLLGDKLIGITSSGGSANKNIWFVAQTPYVGANGSDLSAISQLTPIALVHESNLAVLDMWKSAKLFKTFDTDEIGELISRSECDRAVYFGKTAKWYSMPKLENHSGYDRETQTYLLGFEPQDGANKQDAIKAKVKEEDKAVKMEPELSDNAKLILRWLQNYRFDEWVTYRGAGNRDTSFRRLLAENNLDSDDRDDAMLELFSAGKIERSSDERSIRLK